jgi:hypothetical protein
MDPIAVCIYTYGDDDLYSKQLHTEEEIQAVIAGVDEGVEEYKSYIIRGTGLKTEDHT